jgi:hypothetical protein
MRILNKTGVIEFNVDEDIEFDRLKENNSVFELLILEIQSRKEIDKGSSD